MKALHQMSTQNRGHINPIPCEMAEEQDQRALLDVPGARRDNARVFCVGVGSDVNKPLLAQLAGEAGPSIR